MTAKARILLVDDEPDITAELTAFLERAGFIVAAAGDGREALQTLHSFVPDLIVLDIIMPGLNGRELLRHLRQAGNWIPIILLTRVGDAAERAMALEEGADDYMNKSFDPQELAARIHAVLRRARPGRPPLTSAERLACGALRLDRLARRVLLGSKEPTLTPKAFQILEYMLTHPNEVLSRERLLDTLWDWEAASGTRAVDVRIAELRRALQDDPDTARCIETVPGQGYRFVGQVEVLP